MKKTILTLMFVAISTIAFSQNVYINLWDFENSQIQEPTIGEGSIGLLGTCVDYTNDPWVSGNPGVAYNTGNYPEQGQSADSSGILITAENIDGNNDVYLNFDKRNSNTAAKHFTVLYSVDGGNGWIGIAEGIEQQEANVWESFSIKLPSIKPETSTVLIRITSSLDPDEHQEYVPTNEESNYSPNGTFRYDNISLTKGPLLSIEENLIDDFKINTVWFNTVNVQTNKNFEYKIYDYSGRVLKIGKGTPNDNLFVGDMLKGNYIISINIGGKIKTFKVIKR